MNESVLDKKYRGQTIEIVRIHIKRINNIIYKGTNENGMDGNVNHKRTKQ